MKLINTENADTTICSDLDLLEECMMKKQQSLVRQTERMEAMKSSIHNTKDDIAVLKAILHYVSRLERGEISHPQVAHKDIPRFFARASRLYDLLCHRMHCHIDYTCFCAVIHLGYEFEVRPCDVGKHDLSRATVLGYFKKERE